MRATAPCLSAPYVPQSHHITAAGRIVACRAGCRNLHRQHDVDLFFSLRFRPERKERERPHLFPSPLFRQRLSAVPLADHRSPGSRMRPFTFLYQIYLENSWVKDPKLRSFRRPVQTVRLIFPRNEKCSSSTADLPPRVRYCFQGTSKRVLFVVKREYKRALNHKTAGEQT